MYANAMALNDIPDSALCLNFITIRLVLWLEFEILRRRFLRGLPEVDVSQTYTVFLTRKRASANVWPLTWDLGIF